MTTLAIAFGALVLYLVAYHTYGRWLSRRVFRLDPAARVPSVELEDDVDYVPTPRSIVFGHHFTSIAGTGPIVGPALAVIWGWVPALLWVLFGSIFIGAVHDLGALVVSLRQRGQTVGDIAGRVLNPRVRLVFLFILLLALTIVLAIFGLVIASVFRIYPSAIFPCLVQVPLAIGIGVWLHRKGVGLFVPSLITLALMYASVVWGDVPLLHSFNESLAAWSPITWVAVLLVYSYVASVLPVWSLLQPRDYINSLQLLTVLALVVAGLVVAAFAGGAPLVEGGERPPLEIVAPSFQRVDGAPWVFPFLFITIACGAISGFHCLVSSGTTSKQLRSEPDAQLVGYGSMLTEGFLATLVILACAAGLGLGVKGTDGEVLTGAAAWSSRYASWKAAEGLGPTVSSFVGGSANFLGALGFSNQVAIAFMGVLVASFAGTTLDTACRLQRYVVQELASTSPALVWLRGKHAATLFAVGLALFLAALPPPGQAFGVDNAGKGGLILWPLFGATNQLLGGLSFLVIVFWLWRRGLPVVFAAVPMVFMLVVPAWAMVSELLDPASAIRGSVVLTAIAAATFLLEAWMVVEAFRIWPRARGQLEAALAPLPSGAGSGPTREGGRSC